ncbi:hypothetical protein [Agromyces sp. LHK192]|uniref:copper amine oxidase n=1 Tax=Agromyces sp. LHK192 TaxID=2498704 RepID=UPI000FDAD3D2|nr:hypothetical protein [Agromyces sp. LHK192]
MTSVKDTTSVSARLTRSIALAATAVAAFAGLALVPATAASAAPPPINCSGDALIEKEFDNGTAWQMCWRVDSKKGLVLEQVAVKAPGEDGYRRVLDSVYLSQLHVPYDTGKNVWNDITSYGFGNQYLQKLSPAECGDGTLRDVAQTWTTTRRGETTTWMRTIPALCITDTTSPLAYRSHEQSWGSIEDAPLFTADKQGFTLQTISKVDWYEYATKVEFTDEGGISFDLGATGDVSYEDFDADATTGWPIGTDASAFAASHWHNAIWRLDFGLDGQEAMQVEQYDSVVGEMGEKTELMHTTAQTIANPANLAPVDDLTWWRVAAPGSVNGDGHVRSYEFVFPGSQLYQADPVTQPLITVTNYNACQEYATNNLNPACTEKNVIDYVATSADQSLTDPVAWVNSGFHHVVRDEDQSPMQTHWQSFSIIPRDWTAQSMGTPAGRSCINGDPGGEIHTDEQPCEQPTEPTEQPTEPTEEPTAPTEQPTEPTEQPTEPTEQPTEGATLTLSATELSPGEEFDLEGTGFAPDESVAVELHSEPIPVGSLAADASGAVAGTLTVPAGAPAGAHRVVVTGATSGVTAAVDITVLKAAAAAASASSSGSGLASTGTTIAWGAGGLALALVALGIALVVRRRRATSITAE